MTARQITLEVCTARNVSKDAVMRPGRTPDLVAARAEIMARCRDELQMTLPQIGRLFRKHHTTVLHAIEQHRRKAAAAPVETDMLLQARRIATRARSLADQACQIETLALEIARLRAQLEQLMPPAQCAGAPELPPPADAPYAC